MIQSSDSSDGQELLDRLPPEVRDRLPAEVVAQLEDGTIDKLPDSVVEQLPARLQDRIPDDLIAGADSTQLAAVLIGAIVFSLLGVWWSITKRLLKLTLFFVVVGVVAFVWYTQR